MCLAWQALCPSGPLPGLPCDGGQPVMAPLARDQQVPKLFLYGQVVLGTEGRTSLLSLSTQDAVSHA